MAQEYSNETLGVMIEEIKLEIREGFRLTHKKQDYTNGRVRSLEVWRGFITGGMIIIGMVVGYIINLVQ